MSKMGKTLQSFSMLLALFWIQLLQVAKWPSLRRWSIAWGNCSWQFHIESRRNLCWFCAALALPRNTVSQDAVAESAQHTYAEAWTKWDTLWPFSPWPSATSVSTQDGYKEYDSSWLKQYFSILIYHNLSILDCQNLPFGRKHWPGQRFQTNTFDFAKNEGPIRAILFLTPEDPECPLAEAFVSSCFVGLLVPQSICSMLGQWHELLSVPNIFRDLWREKAGRTCPSCMIFLGALMLLQVWSMQPYYSNYVN